MVYTDTGQVLGDGDQSGGLRAPLRTHYPKSSETQLQSSPLQNWMLHARETLLCLSAAQWVPTPMYVGFGIGSEISWDKTH